MKTFTDNAGRTWTVSVNVGAVKAVKDALAVNLVDGTVNGNMMERLAGDPILLADVLYVLCREECEARQVSDIDFGRSLAGDSIDSATEALLEELVDFFPSSRRSLLRNVLTKYRKLDGMRVTAMQQRLDSGMVERAMEQELAKMDADVLKNLQTMSGSTSSAGSLPASSESIPAD
ncbi:MAG: hypothetical protein WC869_11130 [Phycisphaerae bacterium]|jgi:hypothetical protein